MSRIIPNFLIIGAARSGTSMLHDLLKQHPDVYLPFQKQPEPHFFLKRDEYSKGEDYYLRKYFGEVGDEIAIGETSSSYLYGEKVPQRIKAFNPSMKLLVLLREPVNRAYSNYWHSKKNGFEDLDFRTAIETASERSLSLTGKLKEIDPYAYLQRSLYGIQLDNYLKYFPVEQMHIELFEDFIEKPQKVLKEIYAFLEIDTSFEADLSNYNQNQSRPDQSYIEPIFEYELKNYFKSSNKRVEEIIGRSISFWK